MPKADTNTITTRRALALGGGAFAAVGVTAGTAASVADVAQSPVSVITSPIAHLARKAKHLNDRHFELDQKVGDRSAAEDHEMDEVATAELDVMDLIVAQVPGTIQDAMILLMHGAEHMHRGNEFEDGAAVVEQGYFAVLRAFRLLKAELGIDMDEFGVSRYLPNYVRPHYQPGQGRA